MCLCPDCGVKPGELHKPGCDVERCPECGGQLISSACKSVRPREPWTGEWPNVQACRDLNLWCKWSGTSGWVPCLKEDPERREDLNTLVIQYRFDPDTKTWKKR